MLINIHSAKCIGIDAVEVIVEVDVAQGIGIHLVGLADAAVKESLLRTITSLQSLGFKIPGRKIVINLAPADMHKKGSGYDVPIALGIIAASGQRDLPLLDKYIIMGELGLDGTIREVPGALPTVELAERSGLRGCILPQASALEAVEYSSSEVYGVENLEDVLRILSGEEECKDLLAESIIERKGLKPQDEDSTDSLGRVMDFSEIIGQEGAKRGVEIAAAGGHNVIMIGPPGSGKSSLAKAMASILPAMSLEESIQTSMIYSVAGKGGRTGRLMRQRPFRAPHYSASVAALLGGGSDNIMPGEISLAHHGVLFLDELPEFKRSVLEVMRQPLEDRKITISRAKCTIEYPASFMLVASMNPCPCGYYNHPEKQCVCAPGMVQKYLSRISGPLLDRIDIHIEIVPVPFEKLSDNQEVECSAAIRERVIKARNIQLERFKDNPDIHCNAQMSSKLLRQHTQLDPKAQALLKNAMLKLNLSARAYDRILKVARTIADLDNSENIETNHIAEAINYRNLDREGWAG